MDKTLKIKIKVDKDTGAVSVVGGEFDNLDDKVKKTGDSVSGFSSKLKTLAAGAVSIYAIKEAFGAITSSGFDFNKSMESSTAGLSALTVATSSNISAMGKHLSISEKYRLAQIEATATAKELNAINSQTPHTLEQTNQIYKAMYVSMKNAGASNNEMIRLTKQISIAAGAAGIEFNSLLAGVDGLATGTVLANSDLGRFLSSLGLTNEELKKSTNVVELLESKLGEFKSLGTMEEATSNLENAWNKLAGTLTENIFEDAKRWAIELSGVLDSTTEKIEHLRNLSKKREEFALIAEIEQASLLYSQLDKKMQNANKGGFGALKADEIAKEVEASKKSLDDLTQKYIKSYGDASAAKDSLVKKDAKDEPYDMSEFDKFGLEMFEQYEKKQKESNEKQLKESHDLAQKQLSMIQKSVDDRIKLEESYANEINTLNDKQSSYFLDGLAKEALETFTHYESLKEKYAEVAGASETLSALQNAALGDINTKINEQNNLLTRNALLDSITESTNSMQDMLDIQIALIESGKDWASGLSGASAALAEVGNSFEKLHVDKMKLEKADLKSQNDYAKAFLNANGDIVKEKEALAKFDSTQAMLREQEMDSYIGAFGSLAGAVSNYASESDSASKTAEAAEKALAVVQAVRAVIRAWGDPYPLNLITVPATVAATGALLSSIGASGPGGSAGTTDMATSQRTQDLNEAIYEPMTDRLDRQIELLESIDRNGTASQISVRLAATEFEASYKNWVEDVIQSSRLGFVNSAMSSAMTSDVVSMFNQNTGANIYTAAGGSVALNTDVMRQGYNAIEAILTSLEMQWGTIGQIDVTRWDDVGFAEQMASVRGSMNDLQNIVHDWSMSVIDSMGDLKDAADDFEGYYDDITGSMFYETQRLQQAYEEVDALRGENSFASYLQESIADIRELEEYLSNDVISLLMSSNPADIYAQISAVEELGRITGETFEGGAAEALNYLESINLVAAAMSTSRKNIISWFDSLKTDEQRAQDMADALGVRVANNANELSYLFTVLSNDIDGLTDADLEFLNANKALLESTQTYETQIESLNTTLDNVTGNISTLEGALGSISPVIDKLKAATQTSSQSLQEYYAAMDLAESLRITTDYEAYAKSLKDVASASSILFNQDAFSSSFEQRFTQLAALNQFQGLENVTLEEIDYLRLIEENTREQVSVLTEAMNQLGADINSSLLENTKALQESTQSAVSTPTTAAYIQDIYTKYDLHQYQSDSAGYLYWQQQVSNGAVAIENLDAAIKAAALENLQIDGSHFNGLDFVPFDGYRAELHYGERVLTAKDNASMAGIVEELIKLRGDLATSQAENNRLQKEIAQNTQESRFIS